MNKVLGYIEKGKAEGANLLCGGSRLNRTGYFVEPTIFTGVTDEMTIAKEEIFGPVLSILKFEDLDEVIARSNSTEYGLTAGIYSESRQTQQEFVKKHKAGFVNINTYFALGTHTPFGGYKNSGYGREMGAQGIKNYLEAKTVVYDFN